MVQCQAYLCSVHMTPGFHFHDHRFSFEQTTNFLTLLSAGAAPLSVKMPVPTCQDEEPAAGEIVPWMHCPRELSL